MKKIFFALAIIVCLPLSAQDKAGLKGGNGLRTAPYRHRIHIGIDRSFEIMDADALSAINLQYSYHLKGGLGFGVFTDMYLAYFGNNYSVPANFILGPAISFRSPLKNKRHAMILNMKFPLLEIVKFYNAGYKEMFESYYKTANVPLVERLTNIISYDISIGMDHIFTSGNAAAFSWAIHFSSLRFVMLSAGFTFGI